jgi:hypothetical protein
LLYWLAECRLIGREVDPEHYIDIEDMKNAVNEIERRLVEYREDLMEEDPEHEALTVMDEIHKVTKDLDIDLQRLLSKAYRSERSSSLSAKEYLNLVGGYQEKINKERGLLCHNHGLCQEWYCRELC